MIADETDTGFLTAICRSPDDDAPRLVYADWLEEHGDPERAEFIRVQCALAAETYDDPRHDELEERNESLLGQHGEKWSTDVRGPGVREVCFRRGFVEAVVTSAH